VFHVLTQATADNAGVTGGAIDFVQNDDAVEVRSLLSRFLRVIILSADLAVYMP
jgi:hypothetical protein